MPLGETGGRSDPSRRQSEARVYRGAMRTYPQELIARALVERLATEAIDARAEGDGVHWHAIARSQSGRVVKVHCFHYDAHIHALMLGMNPANARGLAAPAITPYDGAEYFVVLSDERGEVAEGRTRSLADVPRCVRAWLTGASLDALVVESDFIDRAPRALRAIAATLDPSLNIQLIERGVASLIVERDRRTCELAFRGGLLLCHFFVRQAQLAQGVDLRDVSAAVRAWLIERVSVSELPSRVEGVALGRHAEYFERDAARWHWLHVRDRIDDPRDVLAPLRPLIERLAESAIVTKFFSYSSLDRLCFSASSHYPWVSDGLPVICPTESLQSVFVDDARMSIDDAVASIERTLAAYPVTPFVGTRGDLERSRS